MAVGLLGAGTVGGAFAELLRERAPQIEARSGRGIVLNGPLRRSSGSFEAILDSSDVIVELIGGLAPARDYALRTLRAGKGLITANKQLLAEHGEELFDAAREHGAPIRFEAAVAGVIPVVRVLAESLDCAHIDRVHGIVNGTTNYILTAMGEGAVYEQALAQAQAAGYAEADPTDDVTGRDAAAKMAILARLAFGADVRLADVPHEGIAHLQADDLLYARELGLSLKLIGTAERLPQGLSVRVHPAFLYAGHPLATVSGPYNAVTIESPAITEITMSGPGAGGVQTASAVLGDLVSIIGGGGAPPPAPRPIQVLPDFQSAHYLHVEVDDRPGVLAAVAGVLGEQAVSIKSVVQRGIGEHARLVMVTHRTATSRLRTALEHIGALEHVRAVPRAIPVIEEEFT